MMPTAKLLRQEDIIDYTRTNIKGRVCVPF